MKRDARFDDPKFRRWVDVVNPPDLGVQPVFLPDFLTILQILYAIFKLLVEMGCIQKAIATRQVRSRIDLDDVPGSVKRLEEFRDYLVSKKKEKSTMKSFLLALPLFVPVALNAEVFVGQEKPTTVYSAKYKKHYHLGLKKHVLKTHGLESYATADVRVPNDFVMMDKWPLPPGFPYDQGPCGSCVVNAIQAAATYGLHIRGLLPVGASPLSRGQVMECNPRAGQCSGDWAENVGGWVGERGHTLSENVYPYKPRNGRCQNISGTEHGPIPRGRVIDNSSESMGKALVQGIPVPITVGAGGAWMNYESGTFKSCQSVGTNHQVLLVGIHCRGAAAGADGFCNFAAAKPGDIEYDILNSWGMWGDAGFIRTVALSSSGRRCNNVAEEAYAFAFEPVNPNPPPPPPDPKPPTPPTPDAPVPLWAVILGGIVLLGAFVIYLVTKK